MTMMTKLTKNYDGDDSDHDMDKTPVTHQVHLLKEVLHPKPKINMFCDLS